jgi:hypothetical protein
MSDSNGHLDGNALAGPLAVVFTTDVSSALAQCDSCGRTGPMGETLVYGAPMGLVARCAGCGEALLRYASTPAGTSLDLRGVTVLRFASPLPT